MNKSVIIVGKGPSISRSNAHYVDSFDKIAICNLPIWKGYEHLLPTRANLQFRGGSIYAFTLEVIELLGLEKIIYTGPDKHLSPDHHHGLVPVEYLDYDIIQHRDLLPTGKYTAWRDIWKVDVNGKNLDPSAGTIALDWLVKSGEFNKIGMIGLDLMATGQRVYYHQPNEMQPAFQRLIDAGIYSGDESFIRLVDAGHDEILTLEFMKKIMRENPEIEFEITTENCGLAQLEQELPNVAVR